MATTPAFEVLNSWVEIPISTAPKKEAPLPKISKNPKYSPDFSFGISRAKQERDSAWIAPWNTATQTAKNQNSQA